MLPAFPEELSEHARRRPHRSRRRRAHGHARHGRRRRFRRVGGERIDARTIFWAAGNAASSLGAQLGAPLDRVGRVLVNDDLSVPGRPEVFVDRRPRGADDTRASRCPASRRPRCRAAARRARNIVHTRFAARDESASTTETRATSRRSAATRRSGVLAGQHFTGWFAWWTWLLVHIMYLAGFRNRLSVLLEWGYSFFTYRARRAADHGRSRSAREPVVEPSECCHRSGEQ